MWMACIVSDRVFALGRGQIVRLVERSDLRLVSSYAGGATPETRANGSIVVVSRPRSRLPEKLSAELETSFVVADMCSLL